MVSSFAMSHYNVDLELTNPDHDPPHRHRRLGLDTTNPAQPTSSILIDHIHNPTTSLYLLQHELDSSLVIPRHKNDTHHVARRHLSPSRRWNSIDRLSNYIQDRKSVV